MFATRSGKRLLLPARAPPLGLLERPSLDVRVEPELHSPFAEIENGPRHVAIPVLVDAHGVPVSQPKHVGNSLRVDQLFDSNLLGHGYRLHL